VPVKYWEIIADNLHNTGWSLGWVSAVNREGRTILIADAHRGKLTAFLELESAILCVAGQLRFAVRKRQHRYIRPEAVTASELV
jgi:hypothetical protein